MEYALVNIVMGDIADIEKKKSMGISNLILGSRGLPIRQKEGGINQEVIFRLSAKASTILGTRPQFILLTDSSKSKKKVQWHYPGTIAPIIFPTTYLLYYKIFSSSEQEEGYILMILTKHLWVSLINFCTILHTCLLIF